MIHSWTDTVNVYMSIRIMPRLFSICRTNVPVLHPNVPPPPHYYADNLARLLSAVSSQYSDLLLDRERDYLRRVFGLSVDAHRLYARLLTRRGPLVRIDSLGYREVSDLDRALAELMRSSLVELNPATPADQILDVLTRDELAELFPHARARGLRKGTQVVRISARYPDRRTREIVGAKFPVCRVCDLDIVAIAQILFFGDSHTDLSTFVLEDLGMLRFETYPLDARHRQFGERSELDDFLEMRALRGTLHALESSWDRAVALEVLEALWRRRARRLLERVRADLVNRLGRSAERARDYEIALSAYGRTSRAPGRERRARLLNKLGDAAATQAVLEQIERAPLSAGERFFAQQFRQGRNRRLRCIPEQVLRLPDAPPNVSVESAALDALTRDGGAGRHLENRLPLGMLGLAFWDVIFSPIEAAFVNPYQNRPADLYWSDFRRARAHLIDARLRTLREPDAVAREVRAAAQTKRGVNSALVDWRAFDSQFVECATTAVPGAIWTAIFDYMLDDIEQTRTGFPDLALFFAPGRFQFVEVKGPGDQLRREQRLWFEFFARTGVPAYVLWMEW